MRLIKVSQDDATLKGINSISTPGLPSCGLPAADCELVRRFDPCETNASDSIGFFLARLEKVESML